MIAVLQGLRGLSILLVFCSHWFSGARSGGFLPAAWADDLAWLNLGKYGVELFFMISGFVITKSLIRHRDTASFGIDRIARIYPVFLALHLLIFISGPLIHYKFFDGVSPLQWLWLFSTNLLMLPGVFDLPIAQIVAWSLSYEILFYALAAAVYRQHQTGAAPFKWVAIAAVAAAFAWFHPRALYFLPGIAAYFALQSSARWRLPGVAGVGALLGFFIFWSAIAPEDGKTLMQAMGSATGAMGVVAALACAALFFFQLLYDKGWLKRVMASRWLVALGEVSYSFYLLHIVVVFVLKRVTTRFIQPRFGDELSFLAFGVAAFALTYLLSVLSRKWLEVRAGQMLKEFLSRARARHAATHGAAG